MVDGSKSSADQAADIDAVAFPVHQEELHVDKKLVDTGKGVRIHKTVVEQPCRIDETLLHEELVVRHVPIDKIIPLSDPPTSRYEGSTLIVPVLEEVLVVEKRLRLKEEIHIDKKQREEHHAEIINLKSEAVAIERFDEQENGPKV